MPSLWFLERIRSRTFTIWSIAVNFIIRATWPSPSRIPSRLPSVAERRSATRTTRRPHESMKVTADRSRMICAASILPRAEARHPTPARGHVDLAVRGERHGLADSAFDDLQIAWEINRLVLGVHRDPQSLQRFISIVART